MRCALTDLKHFIADLPGDSAKFTTTFTANLSDELVNEEQA